MAEPERISSDVEKEGFGQMAWSMLALSVTQVTLPSETQ
jgi:hypothetical protein